MGAIDATSIHLSYFALTRSERKTELNCYESMKIMPELPWRVMRGRENVNEKPWAVSSGQQAESSAW
jgi:hypothetical protein